LGDKASSEAHDRIRLIEKVARDGMEVGSMAAARQLSAGLSSAGLSFVVAVFAFGFAHGLLWRAM